MEVVVPSGDQNQLKIKKLYSSNFYVCVCVHRLKYYHEMDAYEMKTGNNT